MVEKKEKSKLIYSGNVQVQTDDPKKPLRVGGINLYEVHSQNQNAPVLSGEVRIKDRIYRVALWQVEG